MNKARTDYAYIAPPLDTRDKQNLGDYSIDEIAQFPAGLSPITGSKELQVGDDDNVFSTRRTCP